MNIFLLLIMVSLFSFIWGVCIISRSYKEDIAAGKPILVKGKVYIAVKQKLSPRHEVDQ